jgi:hypothetical protein
MRVMHTQLMRQLQLIMQSRMSTITIHKVKPKTRLAIVAPKPTGSLPIGKRTMLITSAYQRAVYRCQHIAGRRW